MIFSLDEPPGAAIGALPRLSGAAQAIGARRNSRNQNDPLCRILQRLRQTNEIEQREQREQAERARHRSDDAASSPISWTPPITQAAIACSSRPTPTPTETPAKPPSMIPPVTALNAEMTKAAMRVAETRTPASSAARGLSPTANTLWPNTVTCSAQ